MRNNKLPFPVVSLPASYLMIFGKEGRGGSWNRRGEQDVISWRGAIKIINWKSRDQKLLTSFGSREKLIIVLL